MGEAPLRAQTPLFPSVWSIQTPSCWYREPRLAKHSLYLFLNPLYIVPDPPPLRPRQHPRDDFSFDQRQRYRAVESRVSRKGRVVAQEPAVAFRDLGRLAMLAT